MLTLRPTKQLARRLGLNRPETMPPVPNRVADWCVHEFKVARYRYLIFCHTASLYPVVTSGRGVTDDASLIECCIDALKINLTGTALEFQFQRWIVPELGEVQWAPIPDRSVQGSINELVFQAKVYADYEDLSPVELGTKLAETPLGILGMNSPDRVFPKFKP